jgi:hypothetical protein
VRKTLPHPEAFCLCTLFDGQDATTYTLRISRQIYIYIAGSNILIDNRKDFIPNYNRKRNKRRRRRRQTNDTLVPCGQFDTNYIIFQKNVSKISKIISSKSKKYCE